MFITASSLGCSSVPTATWTLFAAALARVVSSDTSSMSTACTGANPRFAPATERTPDPQPTSSRLVGSTACRSSRQSRVVACAPVPNARPGSITTATASGGGSSHGGPTQQRPTLTPWWNPRHASSQPSATSSTSTTSKPSGGSSAYT